MKSSSASALAALSILSAIGSAVASSKTLQLDVKRNPKRSVTGSGLGLVPRSTKTISADLGNDEQFGLYALNITVGTPPQPVTVQLDTGSSDLWVPVKGSKLCADPNTLCDQLGSFNPNKSSSFRDVSAGTFDAAYGDGTEVFGDYGNDTVGIGGANINGAIVAIADHGNTTGALSGIAGIGYDDGEALFQSSQGRQPAYQNIIASMKDQGLINTKAYSLWLNDLDSNDGSILFGGIDTAKFTPPLVTLPVLPDQNGTFSQLTVAWTSMSFTSQGNTSDITTKDFPWVALLDSGTTFSALPDDLVTSINEGLGVYQSEVFGSLLPCYDENDPTAMFTFGFGGQGGASINVSLSELLIPALDENNKTVNFAGGTPACVFTLQGGAEPGLAILGDAFLHAAYVVYDLENNQIALAQTKFNQTSSNIVEISSGTALPSATAPSSTVTVPPTTVTGTAGIGPVGPTSPTASGALATSIGSYTVSPTFKVKPTSTSASGGSSSSKSAAGSAIRNAPVEIAMVVSAVVGFLGFFGGMMVMAF